MEQVVLLDESGRATGVMDKSAVHHHRTPLHLAFSCYVFNSLNQVLITRRASGKPTWPGVWTNTCCGHPLPGEKMEPAVRRRLQDELGLTVHDVSLVLPRFRYRAVMADGTVENEMCPVFRAATDAEPNPTPEEVGATEWVDWGSFSEGVLADRREVSPWCAWQVRELSALGPEPLGWPTVHGDQMPAAARQPAG